MATTINLSSGLRVTLPEGITLAKKESAVRPRGATRRTPGVVPLPDSQSSTVSDEASGIAAALASQDMVLVGTLPLEPSTETPEGLRRGVPIGPRKVAVEVDLDPNESAMVLLEQNGLYVWHFDDASDKPGPTLAAEPHRRRGKSGSRTVTFQLSLDGSATSDAKTRGWIKDLVIGKAQAFVFKFASRFLLGRGAAFLERKVRTGLVLLDGDDPGGWKDLTDFSALQLPDDRQARILLFIHGTFSSTRGGFAALCATPWGRGFLEAARSNYDAVIGFDHPTLSVDPLDNATALLRSLEARNWAQPAIIDAVSHSRGGITLRSLIEYLLPAASLPVRLERVVFVGAVNGGTELAEPKNWRSFIDIYTNLAAGACRAIAKFPQTVFVATLTEEFFKSIGIFAKVLADQAVTEQLIPGLAAMQPAGPFISELNQTQPDQPTAAQCRYYAITSEFNATLALDSLKELPRQLLLALADGVVDQLMGMANDLVVNTDSMTHIDPQSGIFIKDTLDFRQNGTVYHTNYFLQPQVINALARWFELELPQLISSLNLRGVVHGGDAVPLSVPARMDTDILVVLDDDLGSETLQRIQQKTPSYVVVERLWQDQLLHYAFQTEEVLDSISGQPDATLLDALGLHETDATPAGRLESLPLPVPGADRLSTRRVIGLEDGKVVGVAEAEITPSLLTDLVKQAQGVVRPKTIQDSILARRTMPSFTNRSMLEESFKSVTSEISSPPPGGGALGSSTRRRTRGTRHASSDTPAKVSCHFLAEMDDEVVVGETTSVDVTLSREVIQAVRAAAAAASLDVRTDRKLTVELIPKKNFVAAGETRVEAELPVPGSPDTYIFDVKATDPGPGEILVRIRQGMQPLVNLLLCSNIVAVRTRPPVRRPQDATVVETPPVLQPRHQLTIIEIERGGEKLYHYTLESPSLNLKDIYESKPLRGSREEFIKGVYEDIEDRYLSNKTDFEQFQQELREVGGGLWDELFPEKLQAAIWKWRDAIDSILVFSEEPFIPWELVHLKEPGKGLPEQTCFFGQMGLIRWLHNIGWPTTKLRARAGHCHYVIPCYPHPDFVLPHAEQEAAFLSEHFHALPVDPHAGPLRKLLEVPGKFDLLHFACHGVADSGDIARAELLLEGRVEGANYVTEKFRASVIENLSGLVGEDGVHPIVVLNACQAGRAGYKMTNIGGFSRAFLGKGAGMFIAALWSVGDAPARNFTEKLYERLLANDTLAEATIAARKTAKTAREATWLAYTVYGNPYARLIP